MPGYCRHNNSYCRHKILYCGIISVSVSPTISSWLVCSLSLSHSFPHISKPTLMFATFPMFLHWLQGKICNIKKHTCTDKWRYHNHIIMTGQSLSECNLRLKLSRHANRTKHWFYCGDVCQLSACMCLQFILIQFSHLALLITWFTDC